MKATPFAAAKFTSLLSASPADDAHRCLPFSLHPSVEGSEFVELQSVVTIT